MQTAHISSLLSNSLYSFTFQQLKLFAGYAAGGLYNSAGSGSNHMCLPEDPQWKNYINGDQTSGEIGGMEYELYNSGIYHNNVFSEENNNGDPLQQNPVPCAVCYIAGRSTTLMIPAKIQCPDGWTTEYGGYLASEYTGSSSGHQRSSYICLDEAPEAASGGRDQNQAVIYPVEVKCGSLPCPLYPTGRELTCIVCSK